MKLTPSARYLILALVAVLALTAAPLSPVRAAEGFTNLEPGRKADLDERVPVNFVFVGYEESDIDVQEFLAGLPTEYRPVVRSRLWYGASRQQAALGLNYTYDYNAVFADSAYETAFFGFLSTNAEPAPLTLYQRFYNGNEAEFCAQRGADCQQNGVRDIEQNHHIDAPTVERYLVNNAPAGVDTSRNTIFFINWWGNGEEPRAGFKDHVYTKTNEPDPDTGYNFGALRESRKIIAWGGTAAEDEEDPNPTGKDSRTWFYDLSAGPEVWTANYNVDAPDLDGDGEEDVRFPPVWEYFAEGGYRGAGQLSSDLSKVARYAAINLLFTSSPIYPPQFTPRLLPNRVNLDVNTVEGISGVDASTEYQTPELLLSEVSELHRLPYTLDQQDIAWAGKARECYIDLVTWLYSTTYPAYSQDDVCYSQYKNYSPFANLFLYGAQNRNQLFDDQRYREYEAGLLNWAVEDGENFETSPFALGFADDNYRNGTQSFVFSFLSPAIVQAGYGLTTTEIHEYGHHLNLSHPHDGYDWETDTDYGPGNEFFFAWSGDEHNSMMSYIDLNWDFSQFDQDNTNRFQAAAYINNANAIAGQILAAPEARRQKAAADLAQADRYYGLAKAAIASHDYDATFDYAKRTYESVLSGARKASVQVRASEDGRTAIPGERREQKIPGEYIDKDRTGPESKRWLP